jgi:hypothetical protein
MADEKVIPTVATIPFDKFWTWLQRHPNCIVAAGTPDAVVHDHEDYHWHFGADEDGRLVVEVIRGKQLVAELALVPGQVAIVEIEERGEEEFLFECIANAQGERVPIYHFVLQHNYEEAESGQGRWIH